MKKLPTVKIVDKNRRGFKTINESDFDSKKMKKYDEKKPSTKTAKKDEEL